jgi:hypothetical protein
MWSKTWPVMSWRSWLATGLKGRIWWACHLGATSRRWWPSCSLGVSPRWRCYQVEPLGWDGEALPHISDDFLAHFGALATLDWADQEWVLRTFWSKAKDCARAAVRPSTCQGCKVSGQARAGADGQPRQHVQPRDSDRARRLDRPFPGHRLSGAGDPRGRRTRSCRSRTVAPSRRASPGTQDRGAARRWSRTSLPVAGVDRGSSCRACAGAAGD